MKTALVTGGTRGIGAEICRKLAGDGWTVLVNARRESEELHRLIDEIGASGGTARAVLFDMLDPGDARQSVGGETVLDLVVNNAGILRDNLIAQIGDSDWDDVIGTNILGPMRLFEVLRGNLLRSPDPVVLSMASISGVRPREGQGAYAVSKAMLIRWTAEMARREERIRFHAISPGPVATEMIRTAPWYSQPGAFDRIPLKRFAEPAEIAEIAALLARDPSVLARGANLVVDGGFIQTTRGGER